MVQLSLVAAGWELVSCHKLSSLCKAGLAAAAFKPSQELREFRLERSTFRDDVRGVRASCKLEVLGSVLNTGLVGFFLFVASKISICLKKHFKDCFPLRSASDALGENGNVSVREHTPSSLAHQSIPTTNPPTPHSLGAHPSQSAHSGGDLSTVCPSVPHGLSVCPPLGANPLTPISLRWRDAASDAFSASALCISKRR